MSVIGTGVAAGVAQSGLQAQQVARDRDRKKTQESDSARRVREAFETQLAAVNDVEKVEPTDHLQIDGHLPQQQHDLDEGLIQPSARQHQPQTDNGEAIQQADTPVDPSQDSEAPPSAPDADDDAPLYHHLDVKG